MVTAINNLIHSLNVSKKETQQADSAKERDKVDKSQAGDYEGARSQQDVVEISTPIRPLVEANAASGQASVKDVDEAERLLRETLSMIPASGRDVYTFSDESLAKLLS